MIAEQLMTRQEAIKFGRYEVVGEIGRGSMGVVYKARDPVIGRLVAVKSIPETFGLATGKREEFVKRLRQEAMTAGRLSHPNIVIIYDVGEVESGPFIAMEHLDGVTLRDVITAQKRVSLLQLQEIVSQVGEGLDYAHSKAIVHRDIKPANIMIVADNRVKIMDLGIARLPMSELTREGKLVGSPSYMSPEQLSGETIDGRSDLFSLGVCIYQLMTFKKPFPGDSINEICYKIVHEDFTPPSRHQPELPPSFDEFMTVALAKDPDQRFQSGAEMVAALSRMAESSTGSFSASRADSGRPLKDEVTAGGGLDDRTGSNPSLAQSSNIDDIFKDLTLSSRITDLKRQVQPESGTWKMIGAGALAGFITIVLFFLIRSC